MSTSTIALIVALLAIIAVLIALIAGSINAYMAREEGDPGIATFRHGCKAFSAGLGVMIALYTAFVLPFVFLLR